MRALRAFAVHASRSASAPLCSALSGGGCAGRSCLHFRAIFWGLRTPQLSVTLADVEIPWTGKRTTSVVMTKGLGETRMFTLCRFLERCARWPMAALLMLPLFAGTPSAHAQAYLTCTSLGQAAPGVSNGLCAGSWVITALPAAGAVPGKAGLSSLIGYPRTTKVTSTVPAYLSCTQAASSFKVPGGCIARINISSPIRPAQMDSVS